MTQLTSFTTGGLSPCVWGHQKGRGIYIRISGSIPMCMAPPHSAFYPHPHRCVYPHVYGATTPYEHSIHQTMGLSPCVWGHLSFIAFSTTLYGSIPMCMGPPICLQHLP